MSELHLKNKLKPFYRILNSGVEEIQDRDQKRDIRTCNALSIFVGGTTFPWLFIFYYFGLNWAGNLLWVFSALYFLVPLINHFSFYKLARYSFIISLYLAFTIFSVVLGKDSYVDVSFITAIAVAYFLTRKLNDIMIYLAAAWSIFFIVVLRFTDFTSGYALEDVSPSLGIYMFVFNILMMVYLLRDLRKDHLWYVDQLEEEIHENEKLLDELHHRVHNNFQLILSLFHLHVNLERSETDLIGFERRVRMMAIINRSIHHKGQIAYANAKELSLQMVSQTIFELHNTSSKFKAEEMNVDYQGPDFELSLDQSVAFGVLLCECALQLYEKGVLDSKSVKVFIKVEHLPNNKVRLKVGTGKEKSILVDGKKFQVGLAIMETYVQQLKGDMKLDWQSSYPFEFVLDIKG